MKGVEAGSCTSPGIPAFLSLCGIQKLAPSVGALKLNAVAEAFLHAELHRVVPGAAARGTELDGAPVGIHSRRIDGIEVSSVDFTGRYRGVAFRGVHQIDTAGTCIREGQQHI